MPYKKVIKLSDFLDHYDDYMSDGCSYASDDSDSPLGSILPESTYNKDGSDHSSDDADNFRKRLHGIFLSSDYCDVTLVTSTVTFKAHKVVLAANSDYFNAMFSSTCSEDLNSVVSFKENPSVTSTGLSAILDYAYLGSFSITTSSVRDILEVARHLLMENVTKSCEKLIEEIAIKLDNYIELFETAREFGLTGVVKRIEMFLENDEVSMDNYFEMLDFAMASNSGAVFKKVIAFISQELPMLMFSEELLDIMNPKIFMAMVKANRHGLYTDMSMINFIVKWIETSPEDRLPVLSDVIKEINLLCFKVETLDEIANLPFFKDDEKVKDQISAAKIYILEVKEDDLYVFTSSPGDFNFYCISTKYAIGKCLSIPSRKHRGLVSMYDSSVIAVSDIIFLVGKPTRRANGAEECPCFSYDPSRNVWKERASLPSDRAGYKLVSSKGEVYAIGGRENGKPTSKVDVYNFTRDEWRTETPLPRPFWSLTAAALNGSIYVYVSGYESSRSLTSAFLLKYDRDGKKWVVKRRPKIFCDRYGFLEMGHLAACTKGLYLIANDSVKQHDEDIPALSVKFYDENLNRWEYSTFYHEFDGLYIHTVSSYMDDMYIIARDCGKVGLFRLTEATRKIELLEDAFISNAGVAIVCVPKDSIAGLAY